MKIESINNIKVKEWLKLKDKKGRDQFEEFMIEGEHLLNEALNKGVVKCIISDDPSFERVNIPFYLVTNSILKRLSSQVSGTNVIAIVKKMQEEEIKGSVCLLDKIQDPGNLGTIIRSAVAFKIDTLILSEDCVDLYNEKVIRATEGMIFKINIIRANIYEKILKLKEMGYKIYGTSVKDATSLKELEFIDKCGIIIGSEGRGMNTNLLPLCDKLIYIPISCESLNAAVAASIIFYEMS